MSNSTETVIYKGQKCTVVNRLANIVTIILPNGDVDHVCERKLKKPEEF